MNTAPQAPLDEVKACQKEIDEIQVKLDLLRQRFIWLRMSIHGDKVQNETTQANHH